MTLIFRNAAWSVPALLLAVHTVAHAQTVPSVDAGSLLRETERNLQAPRNTPTPQSVIVATPMSTNDKAARVTVKSIVFQGASLVPESELQTLVAPAIGQSLTLAELENMAQRVAEYYRQRGWYARVYLPQQDVTDGTVHIQVLEGHYGSSSVEGQSQRANAASVQSTITNRLQVGQPLSATNLERGLLLANDLPGIHASGTLQAGESQGETKLVIKVEDTPLVTGDVGVNNYGLKSTGQGQATGGLAFNNLSGSGDQLALRGLLADNIYSGVIRYGLPLGHDGLRLAAQVSALDYELGDSYKSLDATGTALTGGLTLSYPLIRQSDHNLGINAGIEHRRYDDDTFDTPLHRHRINAGTLGLNGDVQDNLGSGGVTWGSLQFAHGQLDLDDVASDATQDAASTRTSGGYNKLSVNLAHLQSLSANWQILANFSGQLAGKNLDSSERFSLGGPTQIRAYPVNEASGDQGALLNLELQFGFSEGWQAIAFYDAGYIRQHKETWADWDAGSNQPNSYHLSGAGVGLNVREQQWQLSTSLAAPIGSNPGADAQGKNNDGSSGLRGWASVTYSF